MRHWNICLFREIPFVTWNGKTVLCERATEKMISCQHAECKQSLRNKVGGQRSCKTLNNWSSIKERKHVNTDATYRRRFLWFKIAPVHWRRETDVLLKCVCVRRGQAKRMKPYNINEYTSRLINKLDSSAPRGLLPASESRLLPFFFFWWQI